MSINKISTETVVVSGVIDPIATKLQRRHDKLALATAERQQYGKPSYRKLNTVATTTFLAYVDDQLVTEPGTNSPHRGHPWTITRDEPRGIETESLIFITTEDGNVLYTET